jgi:hypothetical protein
MVRDMDKFKEKLTDAEEIIRELRDEQEESKERIRNLEDLLKKKAA